MCGKKTPRRVVREIRPLWEQSSWRIGFCRLEPLLEGDGRPGPAAVQNRDFAKSPKTVPVLPVPFLDAALLFGMDTDVRPRRVRG
jgi:hypothetical protein